MEFIFSKAKGQIWKEQTWCISPESFKYQEQMCKKSLFAPISKQRGLESSLFISKMSNGTLGRLFNQNFIRIESSFQLCFCVCMHTCISIHFTCVYIKQIHTMLLWQDPYKGHLLQQVSSHQVGKTQSHTFIICINSFTFFKSGWNVRTHTYGKSESLNIGNCVYVMYYRAIKCKHSPVTASFENVVLE